MGDIAERVGMRRESSGKLRVLLREYLGARLVETKKNTARGPVSYYRIKGAKGKGAATLAPRLVLPADLFRGWYNPATGLTAPRLGLGPCD